MAGVRNRRNWLAAASTAALLLAAGCATTTPVDLDEPRRAVGTENDVRVDAQIYGDTLQTSTVISIKYDITNNRQAPIAFADIIPQTDYDAETQTVTVTFGTEVPGNELLPRLVVIPPGQKKSFSGAAHVNILVGETASTPLTRFPNALQVKLNFLGDTAPFAQLLDIPERGVHDPKLADELFPKWLERNETVVTNSLPMRWTGPKEALNPYGSRGRRP